MVRSSENGKILRWKPIEALENDHNNTPHMEEFEEEISPELLKANSSSWQQFRILHRRMTMQMWRDSVRILIYV